MFPGRRTGRILFSPRRTPFLPLIVTSIFIDMIRAGAHEITGGSPRRFYMEVRQGSFPNGVSGGARKKQGSEEEAEVGRPLRFLPVAEEDLQAAAEFVPDGSERIEAGFLRAGDPRRVGESPVDPVRLPEEDGADLLGAEADHGVDGPGVDGIQPLG